MHILAIIVGVISAIAVWSWRIRMAKDVAENGLEMAKTAANLPRRLAFKYQAGKDGLSLITDPREAAAIMLMEIARARGGPLTKAQTHVMENEIAQVFHMSPSDAEGLAAHAAWVTNQTEKAPDQVMRKLSSLIVNAVDLGPKEVVDLDGMLVSISEAEGTPTREQLALLQLFRNTAGLRT